MRVERGGVDDAVAREDRREREERFGGRGQLRRRRGLVGRGRRRLRRDRRRLALLRLLLLLLLRLLLGDDPAIVGGVPGLGFANEGRANAAAAA